MFYGKFGIKFAPIMLIDMPNHQDFTNERMTFIFYDLFNSRFIDNHIIYLEKFYTWQITQMFR